MIERFTHLPTTVDADTITKSRGILTILAAMDIEHINPAIDDSTTQQLAGNISSAILIPYQNR